MKSHRERVAVRESCWRETVVCYLSCCVLSLYLCVTYKALLDEILPFLHIFRNVRLSKDALFGYQLCACDEMC